jgi:hypothetical protein
VRIGVRGQRAVQRGGAVEISFAMLGRLGVREVARHVRSDLRRHRCKRQGHRGGADVSPQ